MQAGTVHNAIGAIAGLYTEMVGELLTEIDQLKALVQTMGEQLKAGATSKAPKGPFPERLLFALNEVADEPVDCDPLTNSFEVLVGERRYTVTVEDADAGA